ncbi:MAG: ATP synthase F1 subunit gamma [Psittacicella sp.]
MQAKEIKSKIGSTKKTAKITKAMELVSSAKMKKSQNYMFQSEPYNKSIFRLISHIAKGKLEKIHPLLNEREIKVELLIVNSSNKGLCGSLNAHVFKDAIERIRDNAEKDITTKLIILGNKGVKYFARLNVDIISAYEDTKEHPEIKDFLEIASLCLDMYMTNKIDSVCYLYNHFINSLLYKSTFKQIIPLQKLSDDNLEENLYWSYEYEGDERKLFENLFLRYLESTLYQANLENISSEQSARMFAMRNATDNANDMIENLHLEHNKVRQAKITNEINEISAAL